MKLGVYKLPPDDADHPVYSRVALYDFDVGEWDESSDGYLVGKASKVPSPEELKVRFEMESGTRQQIVCRPRVLREAPYPVEIVESEMSVEDGHEMRAERGGPFETQAELQAKRDADVRVFPDEYELTDDDRVFLQRRGETPISESEWTFNFADEFEFDFDLDDSGF